MLDGKRILRRPLIMPSIAFVLGILAGDRMTELYFFIEHPIVCFIAIIGCFSLVFMGKSARNYLIQISFFMLGIGTLLLNYVTIDISYITEGINHVSGVVTYIEELEGKTEIIVDGDERILVSIYDDIDEIASDILGKQIKVLCTPEKPKSAGNPGGFDYRKYLFGRGISASASVEPDSLIVTGSNSPLYTGPRFILALRDSFLKNAFPDKEDRNLARGILFGEDRNIGEETRREFMESGAGHILAVSGLHIGLIYTAYKGVEKRMNFRSLVLRKAFLFLIFLVYGTASMWSVSVTRAILLVFMREVSELINRRYDSLSALVVISDIMLALRPYLVFSSGFQMSFLAVLGICFFRPKTLFLIKKFNYRYAWWKDDESTKNEEVSFLATMMAVQLLMIPYTILVYHRISVLSLITNWFLIGIAGLYVPIGAIGFLVSPIFSLTFSFENSPVVGIFGFVLSMMGRSMEWINKVTLLGGETVKYIASPNPAIVATIIASFFYLSSESHKISFKRNRRRAVFKTMGIILFSSVFSLVMLFNPIWLSDEVFLDVGQGDALHIDWGDVDILMDGGGSVSYNVGERTLMPYFLGRGIASLDMAISTHEHTDHFLGIEQLNEIYPIERIVTRGKSGDRIVVDEDRYIEILWPIPGMEESTDENYFSRIFKIYDHGVTTLVTGDITDDGERALLEYYGPERLKSHILKVAHHGSRFSSCHEFLEAVDPEIAIISVGRNNYGHPAPATIENLERLGIIVYRTDIDGAIGIIIGKDKFFVCGNRRNMHIEEYSAI